MKPSLSHAILALPLGVTLALLLGGMLTLLLVSCQTEEDLLGPKEYTGTITMMYNGLEVEAVVDKPALDDIDVLLVFHGTVQRDEDILAAANFTLERFQEVLNRTDMMIVSVAYPGENRLLGDSIAEAEAALLWVKEKSEEILGYRLGKLFLAGHSQGGYLVTRLNTMHSSDGVIANAPGPLNLVYRCQLEENGQIMPSIYCDALRDAYGSTVENPGAYMDRSLLRFTDGYLADILFVQGLSDGFVQMHSWPVFKEQVLACTMCRETQFVEIEGGGHTALFTSAAAGEAFNEFIQMR